MASHTNGHENDGGDDDDNNFKKRCCNGHDTHNNSSGKSVEIDIYRISPCAWNAFTDL